MLLFNRLATIRLRSVEMYVKSALWAFPLLVVSSYAFPAGSNALGSRDLEIPDASEFNWTKDKPYQIAAKPNGLNVKRPNMILFTPDQLRFDCVGTFGNKVSQLRLMKFHLLNCSLDD